MALVTKSTGNIIAATDVNQFYNALTGVMTDQPFGLAYSPASSTTTPALKLTGNGNGPLLQGYNGATQEFQLDQNGNVTAIGPQCQFGDKLVGSGSPEAGINSGSRSAILGGTSVVLKHNTYFDGTSDRYVANASAYQIVTGVGAGGVPGWRYGTGGAAGSVISWSSFFTMALMRSNGGGSAGANVWVGTTDPGSNAIEGDVWLDG